MIYTHSNDSIALDYIMMLTVSLIVYTIFLYSNTSEMYTILAKSYFQRILHQSIQEHPDQSLWHVMQADYYYGKDTCIYIKTIKIQVDIF